MLILVQNIKNKIMNEKEIENLLKSNSEWCALAIERGDKLNPRTWLEAANVMLEIMKSRPKDEWDLIIDELNKEL